MKKIITYTLVFFTIALVAIYLSMLIYKQEEISKFNTSLELVIKETENGWYYEIFEGDKILVKQEIIPGVSGKQFFKTKKDAKTIGLLVLKKIRNHEHPIITLKELEKNKIIFKK